MYLGQLMKVLGSIKREIFQRVNRKDGPAKESLSSRLESLVQQHISEQLFYCIVLYIDICVVPLTLSVFRKFIHHFYVDYNI